MDSFYYFLLKKLNYFGFKNLSLDDKKNFLDKGYNLIFLKTNNIHLITKKDNYYIYDSYNLLYNEKYNKGEILDNEKLYIILKKLENLNFYIK